jgi:hypothetical protein
LDVFGTLPTCPLPLGVIDPALNNAKTIISNLPTEAPESTRRPASRAIKSSIACPIRRRRTA